MARQNAITIQLLIMTGFLLSLLVSMSAYRFFVLPQSQASEDISALGIEAPYLRLRKAEKQPVGNDLVSVDVLANTAGLPSNGADVVINYDQNVLEPLPQIFLNSGAFAIEQRDQFANGEVKFSLFSNPDRGEPVVQTNMNEEILLATITFQIRPTQFTRTQLTLDFQNNQLSESNLIKFFEERQPQPVDILRAVGNVVIEF